MIIVCPYFQDYTCPTCQSGFIEALENQPEQSEESDSDMEVVQPFDVSNNIYLHDNDFNCRRVLVTLGMYLI